MRDYLWSKYQQTRAIFRGERAQKPPPPQRVVLWNLHHHKNICNLTATNAKLIKLTASMYLHKNLNLVED